MPTYLNPNHSDIIVSEVGCVLKPGENHSLLVIPEVLLNGKYKKYNITQTNIFPLYNPIVSDIRVVLEGPNDLTEVPINMFETDYVELSDATMNCYVFIQDILNEPPIRIYVGDCYTLRVRNRVNKIIIDPCDKGEIWVRQMTDNINYERWQKDRYVLNSIKDNLDGTERGSNFKGGFK